MQNRCLDSGTRVANVLRQIVDTYGIPLVMSRPHRSRTPVLTEAAPLSSLRMPTPRGGPDLTLDDLVDVRHGSLGSGALGVVKKVADRRSGDLYALKARGPALQERRRRVERIYAMSTVLTKWACLARRLESVCPRPFDVKSEIDVSTTCFMFTT